MPSNPTDDVLAILTRLSLSSAATGSQKDAVLCNSKVSFDDAISKLRDDHTLILDCEGQELGAVGGSLSLVVICSVAVPQPFLFDIVELEKPATNCSIQPLLDLLSSESITKVVYDGRMDFCAIWFGYGVALNNVIDLQVAEVNRRINSPGYTKRLRTVYGPRIVDNPTASMRARFEHIHMLLGLGMALEDHLGVEKSKSDIDHQTWMRRPLSAKHIAYAANDVFLIFRLLEHFQRRGWIGSNITEQSTRYISIWKDEQPRKADAFRSNPFFPLEILDIDEGGAGQVCSGCKRRLNMTSFPNIPYTSSNGTYCHVCDLVPLWQDNCRRRNLLRNRF